MLIRLKCLEKVSSKGNRSNGLKVVLHRTFYAIDDNFDTLSI